MFRDVIDEFQQPHRAFRALKNKKFGLIQTVFRVGIGHIGSFHNTLELPFNPVALCLLKDPHVKCKFAVSGDSGRMRPAAADAGRDGGPFFQIGQRG